MPIALALIVASSIASSQTPQCTSTGDIGIVPFVSKIFPAPRNLRVLLPEGYTGESGHNLHALFLLDVLGRER